MILQIKDTLDIIPTIKGPTVEDREKQRTEVVKKYWSTIHQHQLKFSITGLAGGMMLLESMMIIE